MQSLSWVSLMKGCLSVRQFWTSWGEKKNCKWETKKVKKCQKWFNNNPRYCRMVNKSIPLMGPYTETRTVVQLKATVRLKRALYSPRMRSLHTSPSLLVIAILHMTQCEAKHRAPGQDLVCLTQRMQCGICTDPWRQALTSYACRDL